MTLNFHTDDDFATVADHVESVTLLRRGSSPPSGTTIAHALRRTITTSEATIRNRYQNRKLPPSDGQYTAGDCRWHLPVAELAEPPRLGDVILDADDQRWTVLEVRSATLNSRWQCTTRNLAIAHQLDDTIRILRAEYPGGDTSATPTWHTHLTGVRARIQPAETDIVVAADGTRSTERRVQIFVAEDLTLDHTHAIESADGTRYSIRSILGGTRIDQLQTLDADVMP